MLFCFKFIVPSFFIVESAKLPLFFVNIPAELSDSTLITPSAVFVKLIFLPAVLAEPNIPTEFLEDDVKFIVPEFSAVASSFENIPVDFSPVNLIVAFFAFITAVPSSTPYIPITDSAVPIISLLFVILALSVASIPVAFLPFTVTVPSFIPSVTFDVAVFLPVA